MLLFRILEMKYIFLSTFPVTLTYRIVQKCNHSCRLVSEPRTDHFITCVLVSCSVAALLLAQEICLSVYCVWRPGGTARGSVPHCVLHAAFLHFFAELLRDGADLCSRCYGKLIPKASHSHFKPLTCYNGV
jgi:hypothetical protein